MFDWLGKGSSVDQLIAKKQYSKAAETLRMELNQGPKNARLMQKLADVLILDGKKSQAVSIFHDLVDTFANAGYFAKAIAISKKIERIDPGNVVIEEQLKALIRTREGEEANAEEIKKSQIKPVQPLTERSASSEPEEAMPEPEEEIVIEIENMDGGDHGAAFQGSPLFQGMTDDEILAVVNGLHLRTYEPGEIVVTETEPGSSMFLLASGAVRVFVQNAEGANAQVRSMQQGDFFGEISLLTGSPRTATITAATPCEMLELSRDNLAEIASLQPQVPSIIENFCVQRSGSSEEAKARTEG